MKVLKYLLRLGIIFTLLMSLFLTQGCAVAVDAPQVEIIDDGAMRVYKLEGSEPKYGMVFYVGTVTPPDRYDGIMSMIAEAGYLVVTPYLTFNTAMLDYSAFDRVIEVYPDVEFALGGHSLGGIALNQYVNRNPENVKGIIYYASRPYELAIDYIPCLSIMASNDQIIPMDTILNTPGFPLDTTHYTIEGGNHVSFASNLSFPDGPLEITLEEQQSQAATQTILFLDRIFNKE